MSKPPSLPSPTQPKKHLSRHPLLFQVVFLYRSINFVDQCSVASLQRDVFRTNPDTQYT
ncbi:hypothetical protein COCC4DRAFT_30833 [Bipolaris maydis ATCC 48331]|uniref:Uncharacterized protein n=2 Tax=Cochliobolus heterostrophus TaxID=5016 RepID=M2UXX6_COCH5|nr:uncharacterized protein COCC4DRAFT_30833 [Bipolaris maydis ATCC 48331]EMD92673.1 hypothetical protein COCHEDRAFT_1021336 [Bipolaris maydis C5]ENI08368.1 hypothetical protein COCC4DRAFT_30833 [Bipolaris maydis ATCC 48331]